MNRTLWTRRLRCWLSGPRRQAGRSIRPIFRPNLEHLETRLAPTVNTVNVNSTADATNFSNPSTVTIAQVTAPGATVSLLDAINAANNDAAANPGNSTILNLAPSTTYTLTKADNAWYGPNGLPPIASTITIHGNGATIARASTAPDFRLFNVSGGMGLPAGALTMDNITLSGGSAQGGSSDQGGGGLGAGGAIFNQGTLTLTDVTLAANQATGGGSGAYMSNGRFPSSGGGGMGEDAFGSGNNNPSNDPERKWDSIHSRSIKIKSSLSHS